MKYSLKRLFAAGISTLLFVVAVLSSGILITAETALPSLEYGIENRESNVEYSAVELYEYLFESAPTAAEKEYLKTTGITFSYNSLIPKSMISTDYQSDLGVLSICIRPYVYTAKNGTSVTWLPENATVDGKALSLVEREGAYYGTVEGLFYSEDFEMSVDYGWSVEIPAEVIRELRTAAYEKGAQALLLQSAYDAELAAYETALSEYNAWTAYVEKKEAYDAYLKRLEAFLAAKEAYEAYVREYEQYLIDLDIYEQWVKYDEAVAYFNTQFYDQYLAHQNYLKKFEYAKGKLEVMNSLFRSDSNNWQMYASIMGGTVESVIKHKDELIDYLKCSDEDVDLAGSATEALRVLLSKYNQIRVAKYSSDHEKYAARYAFYLENYDALKLHFTDLYRTLNALFQNDFVERVLASEGKREHYLQFVGQLYVICTCLDETGTRDPNWTISGKRLTEVVEEIHIVSDGDWNPNNTAFPDEVEPAGGSARPTPPTSPRPSKCPEPPEEVPYYGTRPETVQNPDKSGIPTKREEHPGERPTAPTFDDLTRRLMKEIQKGTLKKYESEILPVTLDYTSTVNRMVSIDNLKIVNFYDYDGTLLDSVSVPFGSSVSCQPPVREDTPAYTYRYLGWYTLSGEKADLTSIKEDTDLYAAYEVTKRYYTVTWRLEGIDHDSDGRDDEYSALWGYGELPSPDAEVPIHPYETAYYRYEFSGWDREITPVTGDVTYVGTMNRSPKSFLVRWVVGNGAYVEEAYWEYGSVPSYGGSVEIEPDSYFYTFLGWDRLIGSVSANVTYTALYEKKPIAVNGAGNVLEILHGENEMTVCLGDYASASVHAALLYASQKDVDLRIEWANGYGVTISKERLQSFISRGCTHVALQAEEVNGKEMLCLGFYNDRWHKLSDASMTYTLQLPYVNEGVSKTEFLLLSGEAQVRVSAKTAEASGSLYIDPTYSYDVTVLTNELCYNTMQLNKKTLVGEVVSLRLSCVPGYTVTGGRVLAADGREIEVNGLEFVMPDSAVTVELTVEKISYSVTFMVDGEVWSRATYFYGEEIVLPETPTRPDGEEIVYTFIGWGDVPSVAGGDVLELVFEAAFTETKKDIDYDTGHNNNILAEVIIPCALAVLLLLVGGIITLIVLRKRAKKRRKKY